MQKISLENSLPLMKKRKKVNISLIYDVNDHVYPKSKTCLIFVIKSPIKTSAQLKGVLNPNFRPFSLELNKK